MTEREELARIIDPKAWAFLDGLVKARDAERKGLAIWEISSIVGPALAKADQWLSRPSPVDGVVAAAAEVVARWAMPQWKDAPPTAGAMHRLNDALAAYDQARGETQ